MPFAVRLVLSFQQGKSKSSSQQSRNQKSQTVAWWNLPPNKDFVNNLRRLTGNKDIWKGAKSITFDKTDGWKDGDYCKNPDGDGNIMSVAQLLELFKGIPGNGSRKSVEKMLGTPSERIDDNLVYYTYYCLDSHSKKRCRITIRYGGDTRVTDKSRYMCWLKMIDIREENGDDPKAGGNFTYLYKGVIFNYHYGSFTSSEIY